MNYRIWDKTSPINGCPAETAIQSLGIKASEKVYIIVNDDGADWIIQTDQNAPYKGATIEESAQNHINAIIADQAVAEGAANQPTMEDRISALEAAQLAALGV